MSSEENNLERQSETFSYSLCSQSCILMPVSSRLGTIKLSASVADCNCTRAITPEFPKLYQLTGYPKAVTRPIAVSVTPSTEICDCQEMSPPAPTCESEEEGTHEHKCCSTHCCEHNSQGVQPSSESCSDCFAGACWKPLPPRLQKPHIEPRLKDHVPKSVEELKASITGLTGLEKKLPPGNLLGCEYIDYRCQISTSLPCSPTDSQVSVASCPPPKYGFSLTIEPKDHRFCTNPNECKHSREFYPPPPCPPPPECAPSPECPPPPECAPSPECPGPPPPECAPSPECLQPSECAPSPECPPPPLPPSPCTPSPPPPPCTPRCAQPSVCPPPPQPPCPSAQTAKPVCAPPSKPVCPPQPKPVCPAPIKPLCPPPPKPVCPPPPKPVCPAPRKPLCPPPPKPVCPPPPKPVCPAPIKPLCPPLPKPGCPPPPKPGCPPPPCPPTPPECPEPDCPPSPCPSLPKCPKSPQPSCAGCCEECLKRPYQ